MSVYNEHIRQYITNLFAGEDEVLQRVREQIPMKGLPAINIQPEEGRFLQFLVRACGAVKAVEIGTLGGYSGIWIARGLGPGGRLITLEIEPRHAEVAREHFAAAGIAERVEMRLGNAHHSLARMVTEGPFDFVFIDAEKSGYDAYLDWALENIRLGGIISAHNAFRKGCVAEPQNWDERAKNMHHFNQRVANEPRLLATIFPGGDGMVIAIKVA